MAAKPTFFSHLRFPLQQQTSQSQNDNYRNNRTFQQNNLNQESSRQDQQRISHPVSSLPAPPLHHQLPARPDTRWNANTNLNNDDDRRYRQSPQDRFIPPPRRDDYRDDRQTRDGRWERDSDRYHDDGYGNGAESSYHTQRDPYERDVREQRFVRSPHYRQNDTSQDHRNEADRYENRRDGTYRGGDEYDDEEYGNGRRRRSPPSDLPDRPRRQPRTAPNQSVILIGIPPSCDSDDVRAFIDEFKTDSSDPSPVEDVTIVMDKETGLSKRFCFVRFITLEHARGE